MKSLAVCLSLFLLGIVGTSARAAAPHFPAARCEDHLQMIHTAIQKFREDNKDLPATLSELYPTYFANAALLRCPNGIITGTSAARVGKPNLDQQTTYFYEFSLAPTDIPGITERDRKRALMGFLGSDVPIIRCFLHEPDLNNGTNMYNISFGGEFYKSTLWWERNFTNVVRDADLRSFQRLFRTRAVALQPRPASADGRQIDLTHHYNASFAHSEAAGHLQDLTPDMQQLKPVSFDARAFVQLAGSHSALASFPNEVKGISLNRTCRKLHFLHGTTGSDLPGRVIAKYVVHFQGRDIPNEIQVVYGKHLLDGRNTAHTQAVPQTLVAWEKSFHEKGANHLLRLYRFAWENPHPDIPIHSIDFILMEPHSGSFSGPFLAGITAEE